MVEENKQAAYPQVCWQKKKKKKSHKFLACGKIYLIFLRIDLDATEPHLEP